MQTTKEHTYVRFIAAALSDWRKSISDLNIARLETVSNFSVRMNPRV